MLFRSAFRFCSFNKDLFQRQKPLIQIDNIIKILRPFDIEINIEEMVETVKIVGKYSKHTLYKFPIPQFLQSNSLQIDPKFISETQQRIMKNIPSSPKNLSIFYRMYRYPMRFALPKTVFQISKSLRKSALSEQTLKLAACLENIQIALSLHMMVDRNELEFPTFQATTHRSPLSSVQKELSTINYQIRNWFQEEISFIQKRIDMPNFKIDQSQVQISCNKLRSHSFYQCWKKRQPKECSMSMICFRRQRKMEQIAQCLKKCINWLIINVPVNLHLQQCMSTIKASLTYWVQNGDLNKLNDAFKAGVYLGLCIDFQNQMKYFVRNLPTMSNTLLKAVVNNNECNFYQDKIALPIYFMHQKSKETTSLQQLHDHALKQSEKVIEIMSEKSKEYFLKLGADFEDISDLIEHFCRYI